MGKRQGPKAKKALLKLERESKKIHASQEVEQARRRYLHNKTDKNFRHYTSVYHAWFKKSFAISKKVRNARQRFLEAVAHDLSMVKK